MGEVLEHKGANPISCSRLSEDKSVDSWQLTVRRTRIPGQGRKTNKKRTLNFKFTKHVSILLSHMNDLSCPKEAACPTKEHHKIHALRAIAAPISSQIVIIIIIIFFG